MCEEKLLSKRVSLVCLLLMLSSKLLAQSPSVEWLGLVQRYYQVDDGGFFWDTVKFEESEIRMPTSYYRSHARVRYYYDDETAARYGYWWSETKTTYRRNGSCFTVYSNSASSYTRVEGFALHSPEIPSFRGSNIYHTNALIREKVHMYPRLLLTANPSQRGAKGWDVVITVLTEGGSMKSCDPKEIVLPEGGFKTVYPCGFSGWDWVMEEDVYPH